MKIVKAVISVLFSLLLIYTLNNKFGDIPPLAKFLDPFNGSGTTGEVSIKHHRLYIGCELNPKYVKLTHRRLSQVQPVLMQGRSLTPREPDNGDSAPSQAFSQPEFLSDLEGLS